MPKQIRTCYQIVMATNEISDPPPTDTPQVSGGPPTLADSIARVGAAVEAKSDPTPAAAAEPAPVIAPPPPAPVWSADLDVSTIEDPTVLRSLLGQAQAKALAYRPPATAPAPQVAPPPPSAETPAATLGVFESHALQELGEGTPPDLLTAFAQVTARMESARLHLESADADYARAAKAAFADDEERLITLKLRADSHHTQVYLKASKAASAKSPTPTTSPDVVERAVLAKLARPELVAEMADLPHLAAAIKAGKYAPEWLAADLDYSQPLPTIRAAVDAAAARANQQFSLLTFDAPASPPTPPPLTGARVANPAAFAARPDEAPPQVSVQGPSSLTQSIARVKARIAAEGTN